MVLRFKNTMTKEVEEFVPITDGEVKVYTCGPTVYNYAHLGNFRTYTFQDVLKRYLIYKGFNVHQVMNITDIDDKSIRDSQKEGKSLKEFTEFYTASFFEDLKTLNILPAEEYPKATEHIVEMIKLISCLLEKGIAYKSDDGNIYYSISKFSDYGKLSKIDLSGLKSGARVAQDEYEKDTAADFALWKLWDENDGAVKFDAPFGAGRPGWHIECSAMSTKYLGAHFDMHTGGVDLMFPHHENEIAQSEGCTGEKFVNYWLHSEHLLVNGKKMSKSAGNFYTLRDLLELGHKPVAIRYALLSTHYRKQLDFSVHSVKSSDQAIRRIQELVDNLKVAKGIDRNIAGKITDCRESFEEAMDNDLDISNAMMHLFEFVKQMNTELSKGNISSKNAEEVLSFLEKIDSVLGILDFTETEVPSEILAIVEQREKARKEKDWELADELRDELKAKGYAIDDQSSGAKVKKIQK